MRDAALIEPTTCRKHLREKPVLGFTWFSDGLAATSVLLSYEAETAVKHLSSYSELWDLLEGFPASVPERAHLVSPTAGCEDVMA